MFMSQETKENKESEKWRQKMKGQINLINIYRQPIMCQALF